jgi:pilus assembly protein FimV
MSPRPTNAPFSLHCEKKITYISLRALIAGISLSSALLAVSPDAFALSLGKLTTKSFMGERLLVEIDIPDINATEIASLQANVGGIDTFQAAGIEYNPSLAGSTVTLEKRPDGKQYFKVSSAAPVNDPFINIVIVANWASGRIVRDYSILLDPPEALKTPATIVTAPVISSANNKTATTATTTATATNADNKKKDNKTISSSDAEANSAAGSQVTVEKGQTAGKIAASVKDANISLDQMLVALLKANPKAFINGNVNLIKSGATLTIPTAEEAAKVKVGEAKRLVVSQSKDFYDYRRKVAENAPSTTSTEATRTSGGKVQTQIADKKPESMASDKLVLANGNNGKSKEDKVAKELQAKEDAKRLAALSTNIKDLSKQLNSTTVASAAKAASAAVGKVQDQGAQITAAASSAVSNIPQVVASTALNTDSASVAAATASRPKTPVVPVVDEYTDPSFLDSLPEYALPAGGGILALLLGLFLWKRRSKKQDEANPDSQFFESRMHTDSFFEVSGGQQIDTSESPASGSEAFTASQLNSVPDVDPIAEADVYLAYRRDTSAEEILKDAMVANPTRLAIPLKLLEIYAKRPDLAAFEKLAAKVKTMTKGQGLEWDRVEQLSQTLMTETGGSHNAFTSNNSPNSNFSDFGASALDSISPDINSGAVPANRNMVSMAQPIEANGETNYDIDLDFSSGHAKSSFAPIAANDVSVQAPQGIQLLDNGDPKAAVAPLPFANNSAKNGGSNDIIDFDLSALSLDLNSGPDTSSVAANAGFNLDPSDPAMTKLALAQEFYEIGDMDSAKRTLMEVISTGSEMAQQEAKKLLSQLY